MGISSEAGILIGKLKRYGLFLSPLNNGDWIVGIASYIYSVQIGQDHYQDKYLTIGKTPEEAIDGFIGRIESGEIYPHIKLSVDRGERDGN